MKRAVKSNFKCSRKDLNRLFACNRISALVWNKILELQREKFRSQSDLQKALKGLYPINSQSVQAVADKYCAACLATKSARDCGLANKYPWRRKSNHPTTWKVDGFKLVGNCLKLSLGMFAGNRQPPIETANAPENERANSRLESQHQPELSVQLRLHCSPRHTRREKYFELRLERQDLYNDADKRDKVSTDGVS